MNASKAQLRTEKILSFEDALTVVLEHAQSLRVVQDRVERVPILGSQGRTLAEDIAADRDFPPFPRATRDGYALRSGDLGESPVELRVAGEIRAGGTLPQGFKRLGAGQAIAIMTGAPVPEGADAVVMVEYTERLGEAVRIHKSVSAGDN